MITLNQIILILGGWTALTSSIIYFISNRIADRLTIKWKETADGNIAKLQSELTKNNNTLNSLITLYASNYHQAQERRIKAIEILWTNLLKWEEIIPNEGHMIFNILGEKEILDYWTRQTENKLYIAGRNTLNSINETNHILKYAAFTKIIDQERPFIGEQIWNIYDLYKTFIGRIAILLLHNQHKKQYRHWHNDDLIQQLFQSNLNQEERV